MEKTVVFTGAAPAAIGPYSQAIKTGNFIFISGQIPIIPASGKIVEGDIRAEVRQVMENLKQILESAGSSLDKVVKTTVFLKNLDDYASMNEVYNRYFGHILPARSVVQVARLPRDAGIEIEAIAFTG